MKKRLIQLTVAAAMIGIIPAVNVQAAPQHCVPSGDTSVKTAPDLILENLTNVTTQKADCYEQIVIDVSEMGGTGYDVRYVDEVYTEGGWFLVPLKGKATLQVVVQAPAYDELGNATYPGVSGQPLPGVDLHSYKILKDAKFAGSFEGQTTLGFGLKKESPFTVMQDGNQLIITIYRN